MDVEKIVQTVKKRIKEAIKVFVSYTIEDDVRIYRLKHTPFQICRSLTDQTKKEYGSCPVNPKKIVFDNYMGHGYGCNCKYVTEELLKRRKDLELVWIVKNVPEHAKQFPKEVRLVEYGTKEAMYEYFTAVIWVCNYHLIHYWNKGLIKRSGQYYIQMWHGSFGIKKIEKDCECLTASRSWTYLAKKNSVNTDYWISNSTFENDVYRSAFWSVNEILMLGHPRNDIFFDQRKMKETGKKVWTFLGLEDNEQILLYVPTFRESLEFPEYRLDADQLKRVLEKKTGDRWKIVVRLHPRMQGKIDQVCVDETGQVLRADSYPDIQELLAAAGMVVTDYSSCIFDFLLTMRPGFLFTPDIEAYDQERGFYYRLDETPFPVARTNEELFYNIETFDLKKYQAEVSDFLQEKGSVEDGGAAARVCDVLERIITEKEKKNEH